MHYNLQPKPAIYKYHELISHIENGTIKLPKFQRDFVWGIKDTAELLDSIVKGYPIGTIIIWKTQHRLNNVKNIGNVELPNTRTGESVKYVLDGQQRLASLFVSIKGETIKQNGKNIDYKKIYLNLNDDVDESNSIISSTKPTGKYITVHELLNENLTHLTNNYKSHIEKIGKYMHQFMSYDFSVIEIIDYSIEEAVDVFTRMNTTGKPLSLFDIMTAKTYNENKHFDLLEKYNLLSRELASSSYKIPGKTLLQCIAINLSGECTKQSILQLNTQNIMDSWEKIIKSIKSTIDYFKSELHIPVSGLLPYDVFIVSFSYFFYRQNNPSVHQRKLLRKYFWRSSLSHRFSNAVESKLAQDTKRILEILEGRTPEYDNQFHSQLGTSEDVEKYQFSIADSICKAILCLFCSYKPRSFSDNSEVKLDDTWLLRTNSKNYHHFFPRAYLKEMDYSDKEQNSIANITIISDHLNKIDIGKKSPSKYMLEFKKDNPMINETMETHLIGDMNKFGISDNSYKIFLKMRSKKIYDALKKQLQ